MNTLFGLVALLLLSGGDPDCWYIPRPIKANPEPEMEQVQGCLATEDGRAVLAPEHRSRLELDDHGIGWLVVGRQFYYAKEDGSLLPVLTYDNGADPWAEGLARSLTEGKVAYFNRTFEPVIPPQYDWGWPFEEGRARVCRGCILEPPDADGHRVVTGGEWLFIDTSGKVVDE